LLPTLDALLPTLLIGSMIVSVGDACLCFVAWMVQFGYADHGFSMVAIAFYRPS
jgi:hypothetical protein